MQMSNCGTYTWDGRNVRLACGMTTLLPWVWVQNFGGGWAMSVMCWIISSRLSIPTRTSQSMTELGYLLGYTPEQMDELFRIAMAVEV